MNLPVYKCVIDENMDSDLQVEFVALVDKPAIERNFLAFNEKLRFAIDEDKRIVSGPAMLADMMIYRNDPQLGEYYTLFDKASILSIVQKFFKKGFIQNFNLMHDPAQRTEGVTIYESFITDTARGIAPMKGFEDAADGSWFLTAKVDDESIWQKVKSGEVKGFSVEGIFKQVPVRLNSQKLTDEQVIEQIKSLLNQTTFTD
jgi:hypothetical protein